MIRAFYRAGDMGRKSHRLGLHSVMQGLILPAMFGLSLPHILLVIVLVLLLFGANKVPSIMENFAQGIKAFKKGITEEDRDDKNKNEDKKL